MKNKYKILKIILLSFMTSVLFISCGVEEKAEFNVAQITISLKNIICVTGEPTATDIEGYETLYSSDTIVKVDDNTTIAIYHDEDGLEKVCLVHGNANIVR